MKRLIGASVAVMLLLVCGYASALTLVQYNYWHFTLSQTQRNSAILAVANRQLNATGRCNCYAWASEMVSTASGTAMTIPSLASDSTWKSNIWIQSRSYVTKAGTVPAIKNTSPGQIVQMRTLYSDGTWGPHTAIIHHTDTSGVWFIDANYTKCKVTLHYMNWEYFNSHVSNYSINVIG